MPISLFNPWVLVGLLVLLLGSAAGGAKLGMDHVIASTVKEDAKLAAVEARAAEGAAKVIAKIDIKQTTIRQTLEHTIRENTFYRDCVNDPVAERMLDAARANAEPEPVPDNRGVP